MSRDREEVESSFSVPPSGADRREFVRASLGSALVLGLGGALSPAGLAMADGPPPADLGVFDPTQAETYGAWCDVLVPGAAQAGVARYVDKQLAGPSPDSLLLLRVLANPPLDGFYEGGIAGIDLESEALFGRRFVTLAPAEQRTVVEAAAKGSTRSWKTPDPGFFYFVSRADAVDVVWGTERGFRKLHVPYLAHIRPSEPW